MKVSPLESSNASQGSPLAKELFNLRGFDGVALLDALTGREISFLDFSKEVFGCAGSLTERSLNNRRIGILCADPIDYAVALFSASLIGVAVPLNPASTNAEIARSFSFFNVDSILISGDEAFEIGKVLPTVSLNELRQGGWPNETFASRPAEVMLNHFCLLLRTSGSTGRPKKVGLSAQNLVSGAQNVATNLQLSPEDSCLNMWNRHLIGGVVDTLLAPLISGSTVVFGGPFDPKTMRELLITKRPTWTQFVPTTLNEFIRFLGRNFPLDVFDSMSFVRVVGAELGAEAWRKATSQLQVPIVHTWGMTEAGPLIASTKPLLECPSPGNVGAVVKGIELRPKEIGSGKGSQSEFLIRGPSVIKGYLDETPTPENNSLEGWFSTGDLGYVNSSGEIVLTGRVKDLIRRGALTVYPRLIEDCANQYPEVVESACVGIPHKTLGEDVVCVIVSSSDDANLAEKVGEFIRMNLPLDQAPSRVIKMNALPRNEMGKISRDLLRREVLRAEKNLPKRKRKDSDVARFLLSLWKEELDSRSISVTTNFFFAGGDSLSAVRVAAEIKAVYGIALPPDWPSRTPTVALLENFILDVNPSLETHRLPSNPFEGLKNKSVLAGENSMLPQDFLESIVNSNSEIEFLQAIQVALRHLVPDELLGIAGETRSFGESRNYRFPSELFPKRDTQFSSGEWNRTSLGDFITRYQYRGEQQSQIVVAFTGFGSNLMIPVHMFLDGISSMEYDLLLIFDPNRSRFQSGVPGLGGSLNEVIERIGSLVESLGYSPTASFGVSGGTLAASRFALANREVNRLSIAGPASAGLAGLPHLRPRLSSRVLSPLKARDLWGTLVTKSMFPVSKIRIEFQTRSHNVLFENFRKGTLNEALSWLLL